MLKALLTGITMGLYLAISVGPILFTVINHRLNHGIKGGFSFVAGIWLSDLLFVLLSNVFTVFTKSFADLYIRQIGYGGGLLLILLATYYIFFKQAVITSNPEDKQSAVSNGTLLKLFGAGFLINTVNPILFFEWLTAATVFASTYTISNRIVLFAACLSINVLSDVLKIFLAGKIKERLTIKRLTAINKGTGLVLLMCGLFLMYQTWFHADQWKTARQFYLYISIDQQIS